MAARVPENDRVYEQSICRNPAAERIIGYLTVRAAEISQAHSEGPRK